MRVALALTMIVAFLGSLNATPRSSMRDPIRKVILTGEAAQKYTAQREQKDPAFARYRDARRKRLNAKGFTHIDERAIVVRVKYSKIGPKRTTENLLSLVIGFVVPALHAQDEYVQCDKDCYDDPYDGGSGGGGDTSIFPFDDGNADDAAWSSYSENYDAGVIVYGDTTLDTNDPDDTVDVEDADMATNGSDGTQSWAGIVCTNSSEISRKIQLDAWHAAEIAGAAGLVGCIGATVGYLLCLGAAFGITYAGTVMAETSDMNHLCKPS